MLPTLVSTAARSAVESAMPATVTAVRTRFFASDRSVKRVKMPMLAPPLVRGHAPVLDGDDAVGPAGDVLVMGDDDE